jgi:hypothetical protein
MDFDCWFGGWVGSGYVLQQIFGGRVYREGQCDRWKLQLGYDVGSEVVALDVGCGAMVKPGELGSL